jgi:gas vesicle protein
MGFISGFAIGGGIALLFAPVPGAKVREQLVRSAGRYAEDVKDQLTEQGEVLLDQGREIVESVVEQGKEFVESQTQNLAEQGKQFVESQTQNLKDTAKKALSEAITRQT